jgi:PKD repeat protein
MSVAARKTFLTIFIAGILCASSLLFITPISAQERRTKDQQFPQIELSAPARGAAILDSLGRRLPEVAAWYGKSVDELTQIVLQDKTAWIDRRGHLLYACELDDPLPDEGEGERDRGRAKSSAPIANGPFSLDQTFALHSRPGATKVIYLDFNGHITSGTYWNSGFRGGAEIITPPYDIDGDTSSFSATELERIQYIWQRVAEDYAPFDVDVATQEPNIESLRRTSSNDENYGVRVAIGGSSSDWYGASAGGIAYTGSFNWDSDTPCFVWKAQLGNGNEKYVAEAASHEAGHTLGLSHDGQTDGSAYYAGHGSWAPIMGNSYGKDVTQWSRGEYTAANNTEDDLAVMQQNGAKHRADDHGNTTASATRLSGTNPSATGLIQNQSDVDVFAFSTKAGQINFTVDVAPRGPDLDVQLALLDANGAQVAVSNSSLLGTTLSATVETGSYYLHLSGIGAGNPATTGYSSYASLGEYKLIGSVINPGTQTPTADATATPTSGNAPLAVTFSSANSNDLDGSIVSYAWNFGNNVTSPSPNPGYTYTTPGTYTATLTVTDNSGASATDSVTITVRTPPNQSPVASVSAPSTSGNAPLIVAFSSAGSNDPDGSIASYSWNFGNGATSTAANPAYTYTSVGTFTATLTVTDNSGATASASVAVTVTAPPSKLIFVSDINMSVQRMILFGSTATVEVIIKDNLGALRPGVTVAGRWSGVTSGNVTGTTDSNGRVTFTSLRTTKRGNFYFSVTDAAAAGYEYAPERNVQTSDSMANR